MPVLYWTKIVWHISVSSYSFTPYKWPYDQFPSDQQEVPRPETGRLVLNLPPAFPSHCLPSTPLRQGLFPLLYVLFNILLPLWTATRHTSSVRSSLSRQSDGSQDICTWKTVVGSISAPLPSLASSLSSINDPRGENVTLILLNIDFGPKRRINSRIVMLFANTTTEMSWWCSHWQHGNSPEFIISSGQIESYFKQKLIHHRVWWRRGRAGRLAFICLLSKAFRNNFVTKHPLRSLD